jgi:chemotaxis protein methyltransferase CheR
MALLERDAPELETRDFEAIRDLVYDVAGIHLHEGKRGLVRARLIRRLKELDVLEFSSYVALVRSPEGRQELPRMVDILTTNKTSFFRESAHFDFLTRDLAPVWATDQRDIRIWSAGCSTGEEPYTLAMLLRRDLSGPRGRILATDISQRVLEQARAGLYTERQVEDIPVELQKTAFTRRPGQDGLSIHDDLRRMVRFARLNLMDAWPMRGPFKAIFCRNVMIHFDRPTQERLVNRFASLLARGGHLFIGHAESLTGLRHPYEYVQPALYRLP